MEILGVSTDTASSQDLSGISYWSGSRTCRLGVKSEWTVYRVSWIVWVSWSMVN